MRNIWMLASILAATVSATSAHAQQIFHSTQSANLPTAETLRGGNWLFEISHRFVPPISDGSDALWGLDGPVYNRLGLSYAPSDRVIVGVQRTNNDDNLELNLRVRSLSGDVGGVRYKVAAGGGIAWNTDVFETEGAVDNEMQLYAQVAVNVALGENAAIGLVPTFLRNPRILDVDSETAVAIGVHAQAYLTDALSVLGEWIFSEEIPDLEHDSGTFGIELETRGHFFKIIVTNQSRMNPTQYLGGTPNPFNADNLRFGFNVTRLLPF